ncbi:MAG: hypothetical protein Ct9H300mP19_15370 [Dehalococcoidia bacterium]|nr:MAG: hypothetical protein Ct9H300mP19_15370 [Dehalococcoidia bacterium]
MLGFSVLDIGLVKERAKQYQELGYTAQKWFFRHGPMSGSEGLKKNVEMVEALRNTLGDDDDIMFDCWQSMDVNYVLDWLKRLKNLILAGLKSVQCQIVSILSGKFVNLQTFPCLVRHHYTRWGMKEFIDAEALDILQPDIYWAGGLSEVLKIAAVATTADLITIPHGHSTNAGIHFSVSQSPIHTPYQEYLIKWNTVHQIF